MRQTIIAATFSCAALFAGLRPALAGGCPDNCNGHGSCDAQNMCVCFTGYVGTACEFCAPDYYGYPTCTYCEATTTCSGNGVCGPTGNCICNSGYSGVDCSIGPPPVPTVSEWGLAMLALTGLIAGTLLFGKRRPASNA